MFSSVEYLLAIQILMLFKGESQLNNILFSLNNFIVQLYDNTDQRKVFWVLITRSIIPSISPSLVHQIAIKFWFAQAFVDLVVH